MKVLFTDGPWRLVTQHLNNSDIWCDVQHRCRQELSSKIPQEWWYYCGFKTCGVCSEAIPDEMKGLKALQDWER